MLELALSSDRLENPGTKIASQTMAATTKVIPPKPTEFSISSRYA
jgi:hypothetical protein